MHHRLTRSNTFLPQWLALASLAVALGGPGALPAQTVVNIDITSNALTNGPSNGGLAGVAGKPGGVTWNAVTGTNLYTNLQDENGVVTGTTFRLTGNLVTTVTENDATNTFRIASAGGAGFFQSYAFLNNTGTPGNADTGYFTIGGLNPTNAATVYCYATWNFSDDGAEFRVSSDGGVSWSAWKLADGAPHGSAAAFAEGHSYVMFTNLAVAGDGTLRGEWKTTTAGGSLHNRAPFNALQIVAKPTSPVITEPPPPPIKLSLLHRKLYVVLLGGQSNAVGWGYRQYLLDSGDPLAEPQPDVLFYFYALSNPYFPNTLTNLQCGSGQFRYDAPTTGKVLQYPELTNAPILRFGPELSLSRVIRDRIKIPNSKVAVIKYAVQGSSLYQDWLPDGTTNSATDGALYQKFQSVVWSGLAAMQNQYPDYEIEILGMGWVQGEADATVLSAANNYSNNLARLVADVRATFNTNMVFALSKLSPNQAIGAYYSTVQAAQQAVAGAVPRVVATDTTGANYPVATGFTEGSIHFLSTSLLQIGRDLGNAIVTTSGLDMDEDGLPDAWENSFAPGAAGLGNSPSADYDGDGLTDIQEYEIGTSPVDPNDRLAFSLGSDLIGRWSAKQDIRYQAMASTNLISWVEFGNPVLLRSSNSPVEVDFSPFIATNKSGFFRIEVR